jgi:hypothetical protein
MGMLRAAIAIKEVHGLQLSHPIVTNPFRQPFDRGSMLPGSEGCIGVPWMGNGFLAAVFSPPPPEVDVT